MKWKQITIIISRVERKPFTLLLTIAYITMVVSLPFVLPALIPCLRESPGVVYLAKDCTASSVLDMFLIASLLAFSLVTLGIYGLNKNHSKILVVALPALLAFITILIYYQYTPIVNQQIYRAPIELSPESFEGSGVTDK